MIVAINSVPYGSTAKIMFGIASICKEQNIPYLVSAGFSTHPLAEMPEDSLSIGNVCDKYLHMQASKITGRNGCYSYFSTKRFLRKLDSYHPHVIHLHNLHGWYINLPMLFDYIKKNHIKTIWTLHDCWAFTGQCPHFTMEKCDRWKTGCFDCPQYKLYPGSYVDKTRLMWKKKKDWFTGVEDLTIVTPSQWLADLVKESFLKEYPIQVINNGIDLSVFKPIPSDFRAKHHISKDKKILLGVAFGWGVKKGLDVFLDLSKRLDLEKYQIVLVGTDDDIDKQLPDNIISIHRTQNQQELAEIYSTAELFINPTREDTYPTVNMEALACGTPVLTFKTGGSPEMIDEACGAVVDCDDIDAMEKEIIRICEHAPYSRELCLERAKSFDRNARFEEYVKLYGKE